MIKPDREDYVVNDILSRQYRDWRDLRHKPLDSTDVAREFANLASIMADTFFELSELATLDHDSKENKLQYGLRSVSQYSRVLDMPLSYDNLILYAVELWPDLPVSAVWTVSLLDDINKNRYSTIRDIDRVVKYASQKVEEYARRRPEVFEYSTDFITKSLIFANSEFRRRHSVSPETMHAATEANINMY